MAANVSFHSTGKRQSYSNSGSAIAAGDIVILRSGTSGKVGVAVTDIAATTGTGNVEVCGVYYTTAKASGEAWTDGLVLYTDGTSITSTSSTTFTRVGVAMGTAASAATTGYFIVNGY